MTKRADNPDPFDRYTLIHLGVGAALGQADFSFKTAATLAVGYEVFERTLKPYLVPTTKDTLTNGVIDALAVMGGWYLASQSRRR